MEFHGGCFAAATISHSGAARLRGAWWHRVQQRRDERRFADRNDAKNRRVYRRINKNVIVAVTLREAEAVTTPSDCFMTRHPSVMICFATMENANILVIGYRIIMPLANT